jgi:hypothetical protein
MAYGWYYLAMLLLTFALERPWFAAAMGVWSLD